MNYRAFTSVGILAVVAGSCFAACSSSSSDDSASAGTSSGGTTGGTSNGGTTGNSGGKSGGTGKAGAGNAGTANNGDAGDTGNNGGSGGGGATCVGANTQTDAKNCGHCGKVCESNDCEMGECTPVVVLYPSTANPETIDSTIPDDVMTTALISGNVYEWEQTQDSPLADDLRYTTLRASSTPTTPPSAGVAVADLPRTAPAPSIGAVTYDATSIYQCGSAGVTKTPLNASGATPTKIVAAPTVTDGFACNAITVTATTIFMVDDDTATGKDMIYSIPVASANGTNVPTLVPNIGARDRNITNLTVIGTNLYWYDRDVAGDSQAQLMTAPVTGGVPKMIDHSLGSSGGLGLGTDGTYLYYTANIGNVGELRRAPLATLVPEASPIAGNIDSFKGLVVNGGYVYFMEGISREVFRVKSDGSGDVSPLGVAFVETDDNSEHKGVNMTGVDANYVYFLLDTGGLIARLPSTP